MRAQQTLFRFDARDARRDEKGREQHADGLGLGVGQHDLNAR
jgi:hypothetical protein